MKTRNPFIAGCALSCALLVACALLPGVLRAEVETLHYQGRLMVDGTPHHGAADFKFALYNANKARIVWSNDPATGTNPPEEVVTLDVVNGLFTVSLGEQPMPAINSGLFGSDPVLLRVWADTGSGMALLEPDQKIEPVAMAHHAATVPNGSITTNKLANNAVTGSKIADGTISGDELAAGTVDTDNLATRAVTGIKIADGSITSGKVAQGAIRDAHIASDAQIAGSKIDGGAGSGLDADLLDGIDSSGFLRANANDTFTGDLLTLENDLTVEGHLMVENGLMVKKDLQLPALTPISFESGASSILGFLGSVTINAEGNGDILLVPGDEVLIQGDASIDGSTLLVDSSNNRVGFGTASPASRLHVADSDLGDTALFERTGQTANEAHAALRVRSTKTSALSSGFGAGVDFQVDSSADVVGATTIGRMSSVYQRGFIGSSSRMDFKIYSSLAVPKLFTAATLDAGGFDIGPRGFEGATLDLSSASGTLATMEKGVDGDFVSFKRNSTNAGSISLTGTTVSYNAFTGSHYGHTPNPIGKGLLVTMTGENRFAHEDTSGEPHYGIKVCTEENSQAVLGAYGGRPSGDGEETDDPLSRPHLVNSVGNTRIWLADTGSDIKPGDYLISSAVPGHVQLDPRTAVESHIIGRAAEAVTWEDVTEATTDGVRHVMISVLLDSFARYNPPELREQVASLPAE